MRSLWARSKPPSFGRVEIPGADEGFEGAGPILQEGPLLDRSGQADQSAGGKFLGQPWSFRIFPSRIAEGEGQLLQSGIMPDQQDRQASSGKFGQQGVQRHRRGIVKPPIASHGDVVERRPERIERLAGPFRGRAEHDVGPDPLPAEIVGQQDRGFMAAFVERSFEIVDIGVVPTGFRMAKEMDQLHGPNLLLFFVKCG